MKTTILFPATFDDLKQVDPAYEEEFDAAARVPEFRISTFNYDDFVSGESLRTWPRATDTARCIYRGWMLKPAQYLAFCDSLKAKGLDLVNNPEQYGSCHLFPHAYPLVEAFTPKTLWWADGQAIDWVQVNATFARFMLKDYVKSVKETNFPASFETPVTVAAMEARVAEFKRLRGKLFTGGMVVKEYVNFKRYGESTNEYRAFFLHGQLVSLSKNSNQPQNATAIDRDWVATFGNLGSNFHTVDFAELENGRWIVMETGDGQVSGLSPHQYVFKFYDELRRILTETVG